jgi:hypothetical protein
LIFNEKSIAFLLLLLLLKKIKNKNKNKKGIRNFDQEKERAEFIKKYHK